jgi:hypothetical protein
MINNITMTKLTISESIRETMNRLESIQGGKASVQSIADALNSVFPSSVEWGEPPVSSHGYAEELFGTDDNNNANVWIQDNGDGTFDLRLIMDTENDGELDQTDDDTTVSSVDEAVQWLDNLYNEYRIN